MRYELEGTGTMRPGKWGGEGGEIGGGVVLKGKIVRDTVYRDEMQKCRGKHDGGVSGGWSIMAGSGNPATELHPRSGNPTNCGASSWIGQSRCGASSEITADMRDGRGDEWVTAHQWMEKRSEWRTGGSH